MVWCGGMLLWYVVVSGDVASGMYVMVYGYGMSWYMVVVCGIM